MKLFRHQTALVATMQRRPRFFFAYDTGTGKTLATLVGLKLHCPRPFLILCPLSIVHAAWLEDNERFEVGLRLEAATGTKAKRLEVLRRAYRGEIDGVVMNYEAFRSTKEVHLCDWKTVILDESTRIKSHRSKTAKLVHRLSTSQGVQRTYGLSGCPTPNSLQEWWSQIQAVAPGVLEPTFWAFRNARFYQPKANLNWLWRPKPGAEEKLINDLSSHVVWVTKEQCLDLPEQTDVYRKVSLGKRERETYDKFIRDWLVELEEGEICGITALTELMKCRQMTAGIVRTAEGVWAELGETKLKEVHRLLEEIGPKPVMVIGQFRFELERLSRSLSKAGRKTCLLYGSMTPTERQSSISGFQDGTFDLLLGHPASMGHGLTFVGCSDMIFASLDYSFELYYQVKQRIHRIGQRWPCTYHHLLTSGTIDEDIMRALHKKKSLTLDTIERFKEKVA